MKRQQQARRNFQKKNNNNKRRPKSRRPVEEKLGEHDVFEDSGEEEEVRRKALGIKRRNLDEQAEVEEKEGLFI